MKKVLAIVTSLLLIVVILVVVFSGNGQVPLDQINIQNFIKPVSAADFYNDENTLEINQGTAVVKRAAGESEDISDETTVSIGDHVSISEDGLATLTWFDESITRLKGGTEIEIQEADYNPENISETDISYELVEGEVWNKISNLVDSESEFLVSHGTVVAGVRGTTNNISVWNDEFVVESIKHATFVAQVDSQTKEFVQKKPVVKGKHAVISKRAMQKDEPLEIRVLEIQDDVMEDSWYRDNLELDTEAEEEIRERQMQRLEERVGMLPGDPGYQEKDRLIKQMLRDTDDPREREEIKLRLAEIKMMEGILMMEKDEDIPLENMNMERIKRQLGEFEDEHLRMMDKVLTHVLPDDEELYALKQELRDQQVRNEEDIFHRQELEERFLEREIFEAHDYIEGENVDPNIIKEHLRELKQGMEGVDFESNDEMRAVGDRFINELKEVDPDNPEILLEVGDYLMDRIDIEDIQSNQDLIEIRDHFVDQFIDNQDMIDQEEIFQRIEENIKEEFLEGDIDPLDINRERIEYFIKERIESGELDPNDLENQAIIERLKNEDPDFNLPLDSDTISLLGIDADGGYSDSDQDGIPDLRDNCPGTPNPGQMDNNQNGIGDSCERETLLDDSLSEDRDGDGIPDPRDNCPDTPNAGQADTNDNGIGDKCEFDVNNIDELLAADFDGDGIPNGEDNCPEDANPDQYDGNNNGIGDRCEFTDGTEVDPNSAVLAQDRDGDMIPDFEDNCPDQFNPEQEDSNVNGVGDACEYPTGSTNDPIDEDFDNDGIPNPDDNCPDTPNPGQIDSNQNGIGDACDDATSSTNDPDTDDFDNDGFPNIADNCPDVPNPGQLDENQNGIGDACE